MLNDTLAKTGKVLLIFWHPLFSWLADRLIPFENPDLDSLFQYKLPFHRPMRMLGRALTFREGLILQIKDAQGNHGEGKLLRSQEFTWKAWKMRK